MTSPFWVEPPPEPSGDILSEERESRLQRRRRGVRALLPGNWVRGRPALVLLVCLLVGGLGWFGFNYWENGPSANSRYGPVSDSRSGLSLPPERERGLTSSEYSSAARFGKPLYVSRAGAPVIRVPSTGQVREVTSFEMDFDSAFSEIASPRGRVIGVPGPRGWGLWWRDTSALHSMQPLATYERLSWSRRQESELRRVAQGISLGMGAIGSINLNRWSPGQGAPLLRLISDLKEPYPPVRHRLWSSVPDLWVCDFSLESDLHQGITPGCPGEEYSDALRSAWSSAGAVVMQMEGIARLMRRIDAMGAEERHLSTVLAALSYEIIDLAPLVDDLEADLAELRRVSWDWGLVVVVHFP